MSIRRNVLLLWLGLTLVGCGSQAVSTVFPQKTAVPTRISAVPSDLLITLERTMCYGTCPVYTLTIDHSGKVTYQGSHFVETIGQAETTLDEAKLIDLLTMFFDTNYWDYQAVYTKDSLTCATSATDNPSVITSITMNGKSKSVYHYYGCTGFEGEIELIALEEFIDKTIDTQQWTE